MIIQSAASQAAFAASKMGKVTLASGVHLFAGLNCFEPGQRHEAHTHDDQDKLYLVIEGRGEATVGECSGPVQPGDLVFAPAGVLHSMSNPGSQRLVVLVVFAPPPKK